MVDLASGNQMASKHKDGEYIALYFEDHPGWELVKGWRDAKHCQAELLKEYGDDAKHVTSVTKKYGFWGVGRDEMGEPVQVFYDRDEPGRGRFKVTLAHVDGFHADLARAIGKAAEVGREKWRLKNE